MTWFFHIAALQAQPFRLSRLFGVLGVVDGSSRDDKRAEVGADASGT